MTRKFRFNWKVTVFSSLCFVGFINLGLWQLDREVEKRELLANNELRQSLPPAVAEALVTEGDLQGMPVHLVGEYQKPILLLDNRVLNGKVGFEVHQLFLDNAGLYFLVNRGFVPMGRTREDEPVIPEVANIPAGIVGRIYQPGDQMELIHNESEAFVDFPVIVQHIRIDQVSAGLKAQIYPYVIRLKEGEFGALPRYWPSTVMSPQKHKGYAIQWFTMALAVVIAWLFFSFSKDPNDD